MDISLINKTQEETILETLSTNDMMQPEIGVEKNEECMEEDVTNNEEKELMEDELQRLQKGNVVETISSLQIKPDELFWLQIPLYKLVAMPMVRPTLSCSVKKLEDEFASRDHDGVAIFYVSTTNEAKKTLEFTEVEMNEWGALWN